MQLMSFNDGLPMTKSASMPAIPADRRSGRAERVRALSRAMAVLCVVTSLVLVAGMLLYWCLAPSSALLAGAQLPVTSAREIGFGVRSLCFIIAMVPLGVLVFGLMSARRSFNAFAAGRFFCVDAVGGLQRFSLAILAETLLKPFAGAALSLLLSAGDPSGTKTLAFSVGSDTLLALVFAGTIAAIAWVMTQAIAIADENAQFV
jgi:hypothetical protein